MNSSSQSPARPKPTFGDILKMLQVHKEVVGDEQWKLACLRVNMYNQGKMAKQDVIKVALPRMSHPTANHTKGRVLVVEHPHFKTACTRRVVLPREKGQSYPQLCDLGATSYLHKPLSPLEPTLCGMNPPPVR